MSKIDIVAELSLIDNRLDFLATLLADWRGEIVISSDAMVGLSMIISDIREKIQPIIAQEKRKLSQGKPSLGE